MAPPAPAPDTPPAAPLRRRTPAAALALVMSLAATLALTACQTTPLPRPLAAPTEAELAWRPVEQAALRVDALDARRADRLGYGVDAAQLAELQRLGWQRWLDRQLHPAGPSLPPDVNLRVAGMRIHREPLVQRARADESQRRAADAISDPMQRADAQKAWRQTVDAEGQEAAQDLALHALHSPWAVQERLVWFWLNHFSVYRDKGNLKAWVGDYASTLRPHVLGRFRDLLEAATLHPAMLRYLDNERNAAGQINENFARELLELHTLGVDGGYTQADVQALAHVLTGVGIRLEPEDAKVRADLLPAYVRQGLMEFHPGRHDGSAQTLLGRPVKGGNLDEVRQVLDRLAAHPATARHIATQLARAFVADPPPPALVDRLTKRYLATDGDIAALMQMIATSDTFDAALGQQLKDPWQWLVSATRLAYDGRPVIDPSPLLQQAGALGQTPWGHATPEGWSLAESAWTGPGQLAQRLDAARALVGSNGQGNARFFRPDPPTPLPGGVAPPPPTPPVRIDSAAWQRTQAPQLTPEARAALDEAIAAGKGEWAWLALVSPAFLRH